MPLPVIFNTLTPPTQTLALFDQQFAALANSAVTAASAVGTNVITLTPSALAATPPTTTGALNPNQLFTFTAANTSTGPVTLGVTGISGGVASPLYLSSGIQAGAGDVIANGAYLIGWVPTLGGGAGGWQIFSAVTPSAWQTYVPVITASAGAFTTVSATGQFMRFGKLVAVEAQILITTNGTAATAILATLPFNTPNVAGTNQFLGGQDITAGLALCGNIAPNTSTLTLVKYDGTYPGANGKTLIFGGVYQSA